MQNYVPGVEYDFGGGRVYILAPLNIGTMMRLQSKLEALSSTSALAPEAMSTILQATHASLQRNYPDMTLDQAGDLLDLANMHEVIDLVLDVGGFKRKAAEDAAKNRPAQSASPADPSAGQHS